ncbi:hypothetical protein SF148580_0239 [Shigella flexneri 1485-80]|nr:hypothetical protein SFK404_0228 [Shigella flexneri K-404]EJZ68518.1 hypothetical protein SF148580_0239 [Shigella flexneri 1485-80]
MLFCPATIAVHNDRNMTAAMRWQFFAKWLSSRQHHAFFIP